MNIENQGFAWDRDAYWSKLEAQFVDYRKRGCTNAAFEQEALARSLERDLIRLEARVVSTSSSTLGHLQNGFFDLATYVAACPKKVELFLGMYRRLRSVVKTQSISWSMTSTATRHRLYTSLYGSRSAVEEVLLQLPVTSTQAVLGGTEVSSVAPSVLIHGVRIHSGDILVSRGGAPTSALIARGNDYPGNFSHIALVHVSNTTKKVSIIESHIEVGVVISDVETYLKDKKLRIMVLRLRKGHPALKVKPDLGHRAASQMLDEVRGRHIPYDFAMNYKDHSKQFCSEVASSAYESQGVDLWKTLTNMSGRGVRSWLGMLGVRYFETHGPSDLEYDSQLAVVAEFRDLETLFQDHLDNAVIDAMLEGADRGEGLNYERKKLPLARIAKAYSWVLNQFKKAGPIPEGMSAATGLRVQVMNEKHQAARTLVSENAKEFRKKNGYRPPYWQLVKMAREALKTL